MRSLPPYTCVRCKREQESRGVCLRCGGKLKDARGNALVFHERRYRSLSWTERMQLYLLPALGVVLALGVGWARWTQPSDVKPPLLALAVVMVVLLVYVLPRRLTQGHRAARRFDESLAQRMQRAFDRAGGVVPIAEATGTAHIRGRVEVLRQVEGEEEGIGAIRERRTHESEDVQMGEHGQQRVTRRVVIETKTCGRLAVDDGTGLAVIDDDAFELWVSRGMAIDEDNAIVVMDGDEVEVVGPARRAPVDELEELDGYRGRRKALVYDGTRREPVFIRLLE